VRALVDQLEAGSEPQADRTLEVGEKPEQIALGHRVERVAATSPERHRLEQDLVIRRPLRIRISVHEGHVIRSTRAKERIVVEESGELSGGTRST